MFFTLECFALYVKQANVNLTQQAFSHDMKSKKKNNREICFLKLEENLQIFAVRIEWVKKSRKLPAVCFIFQTKYCRVARFLCTSDGVNPLMPSVRTIATVSYFSFLQSHFDVKCLVNPLVPKASLE